MGRLFCGGGADLRIDHGHFEKQIKIQESPKADNSVRLSRIGTGRHGGRPSQEQKANPTFPTYINVFLADRG